MRALRTSKKRDVPGSELRRLIRRESFFNLLRVIGVTTLLGVVGAWKVYRGVLNSVEDFLQKQFEEPRIRSLVEEVAKTRANELIASSIAPELERVSTKVSEEVQAFRGFLEKQEADFSSRYEEISSELEKLQERNRMVSLGDQAIAVGDKEAFSQLERTVEDKQVSEEIRCLATAEVLRVKSFYAAGSRIEGVGIEKVGTDLKNEQLPTEDLLKVLKGSKEWVLRAKAARLLRSRKESIVLEALVESALTDSRLDVVKEAVASLGVLSGYESGDVFGAHKIEAWWKNKGQALGQVFAEE